MLIRLKLQQEDGIEKVKKIALKGKEKVPESNIEKKIQLCNYSSTEWVWEMLKWTSHARWCVVES